MYIYIDIQIYIYIYIYTYIYVYNICTYHQVMNLPFLQVVSFFDPASPDDMATVSEPVCNGCTQIIRLSSHDLILITGFSCSAWRITRNSWARIRGSETRVSLSLRPKDLLGPVTRVKKKKKIHGALTV